MLLDDDRRTRIEALGYDYDGAPKEAVEACNLCGTRVFTTITHSDRYGFAATTSACATCGLAFLDPRPTAKAYSDFYGGVYRPLVSAYHGRLIDARTVESDQVGYAERLAELLSPHLETARGTRLLDVGGSTGVVSAHLATLFDVRPLVLDPAPAEVDRARARGLDAEVGTIESFAAVDDERYGVALLCQTVDHLLDVAGSLARIRALLTVGGLLFVDIVDFRAAYLRTGSVETATKIDHPYSLTEATAEAFLARAGLAVVRKDYAADHLHVGYVCRAAAPDTKALPAPESVRHFFDEVRTVQNA